MSSTNPGETLFAQRSQIGFETLACSRTWPATAPRVSVVVPTYNGAGWLEELVATLAALQIPDGGVEILIVDDGSTDASAQKLERLISEGALPGRALRLLQNQGRSVARNVGVLQARSEVIAFTDADCLPEPGWLVAAIMHFDNPQVNIVQGRTLPVEGSPPFFSHTMEVTQADGHFATCNTVYRRAALIAAGGFDPALDDNRSLLGTWEDVDMGWRVQALGGKVVFEANAVVRHRVLPIDARKWLLWPIRMGRRAQIAQRYPGYRRHLVGGLWVDLPHALLLLALAGVMFAALLGRRQQVRAAGLAVGMALAAPYLVDSLRRHGYAGQMPLLKWLLNFAWDVIGLAATTAESVRHRTLVL